MQYDIHCKLREIHTDLDTYYYLIIDDEEVAEVLTCDGRDISLLREENDATEQTDV